MRVLKRNGVYESVSFDKVITRIRILCDISPKLTIIDPIEIAQKVCAHIFDGVKTSELDELAAEMCTQRMVVNPEFGVLASRIIISNSHKNTSPSFSEAMTTLYNNKDPNGLPAPLISDKVYKFVIDNANKLNTVLDYSRDYDFDYFAYKTLEKGYLLKIKNKVIERIQHLFMRVSIGIHCGNLKECIETYELTSKKFFTHATPTLFHSGTPHPQLLSCFLLGMDDSVEGIYKTLSDSAMISKWAGGIGIHIHDIRSENSIIRSTNGKSNGLVPMLRVFNDTARHINQCFTPDTWVYTKFGPKQMKDCGILEELYTVDGSLKEILEVSIKDIDDDILSIKSYQSHQPTRVTKEHQLYVKKEIGGEPEYISASELKVGHYMGFPENYSSLIYSDFTELELFIYGKIITFGKINPDNSFSLCLSKSSNQLHQTNAIINYLLTKNIDFEIKHNTDYENEILNTVSLKWQSERFIFNYNDFYKNDKLHIRDDFLYYENRFLGQLCDGLFPSSYNPTNHVSIRKDNPELILQIKHILNKLNLSFKVDVDDDVSEDDWHYVPLVFINIVNSGLSEINNIHSHGLNWYPITEINTEHYSGQVYDFNMRDNHNYLTDLGIVHNSGKRNGSFAMYLEPHHPDILGFLEAKKNHGDENSRARDLFYAMWLSDLFMERVKNNQNWSLICPNKCKGLSEAYGEEYTKLYTKYEQDPSNVIKSLPAMDIWKEILKSQMETGTPYICYKDAANYKSNQKNYGTIKSSNLCVAPETMILTNNGYEQISNLENKEVSIWNGFEWSQVTINKTGENKSLIQVSFDDGTTIDCTPEHKFHIKNDESSTKLIVDANQLKPNMEIIDFTLPVIESDFKENSSLYADGYTFGGNLVEDSCSEFKFPSDVDTISRKVEWLSGLVDANCDTINKGALIIYSVHLNILEKLKLFLQTCGINSSIEVNSSSHILQIKNYDLCKLIDYGLNPKEIDLYRPEDESKLSIKVTNVNLDYNRISDTYCFTEPKNHTGIFNGIITGQCSEIMEYSDDKEYACCTLASISLPTFIEDFDFSTIKSVKIYSKTNCKFCNISKNYIKSFGLDYEEILLDDDDERSDFFGKLNNCENDTCSINSIKFKSVPQIFINDTHIGGLDDLYTYFKPSFNYKKLYDVTKVVTNNLNKIIDLNFYPVKETMISNKKHRPLGLGVQGLADVYARFKCSFDSEFANELNRNIFACIYYAACVKSNELSIELRDIVNSIQINDTDFVENTKLISEYNLSEYDLSCKQYPGSYSSFVDSPMQKGMFQFDLWNVKPVTNIEGKYGINLDWDSLRSSITKYGMRNSLLTAAMPTASTSQILGNNECIEPYTSNIYSRSTLAGQFVIINKYLLDDLIRMQLWNNDIKDDILINNGSVLNNKNIPLCVRNTYKIAWDLSMKSLIDQSADRGPYICQSQSLNLWISDPDINKLTSMHFYAWTKGLKTGIYYLRRRAVSKAQSFTIDPTKTKKNTITANNDNECLMCSA